MTPPQSPLSTSGRRRRSHWYNVFGDTSSSLAMVAYDGSVVLNVRRKAQIAATLKIATKSIDNALSEFVKTGLLTRLGRSDFELNPFLFGKGDWKSIRERREAFVARLRFGPNGVEALGIEREPPPVEQ